MSTVLEQVLVELVDTAEAAYSPLLVAGLKAALARITALEKQLEAVLTPKAAVVAPVASKAPVTPAVTSGTTKA
jgi:hypothetical protein